MNPLDLFAAELRAAIEQLVDQRLAQQDHRQAEPWPAAMTIATAADYIDAPPERLRKLVAARRIPFVQEAPGHAIRFLRSDLDEWLRSQRHEAR